MADCLFALGSNLGDRAAMLDRCISTLCGHPQIEWVAQSTYYSTRPVGGPTGQGLFLNSALRVTTSLAPVALLAWSLEVERRLGRARHVRWGPRAIDVDLLLYDRRILALDMLEVPHPRMLVRRFVLQPAMEIAADMIHPTTGWSLEALWRHLCQTPPYIALAGAPLSGKTTVTSTLASDATIQAVFELPASARVPGPAVDAADLMVTLSGIERDRAGYRLDAVGRITKMLAARSNRFVVSDFWSSQPPLLPPAWYDNRSDRERRTAAQHDLEESPIARIVVLLDTASDVIMSRLKSRMGRGSPIALEEIETRIEQYCQTLRQLARTPGYGPILCVRGDTTRMVSEVQAALIAMDPRGP